MQCKMIHAIYNTCIIDPFDLEYKISSADLCLPELSNLIPKKRHGLLWRLLIVFYKSIVQLKDFFIKQNFKTGDVVFFWDSLNQRNSMVALQEKITTSYSITTNKKLPSTLKFIHTKYYFLSLLFFPIFFFRLLRSSQHQKKYLQYFLDRFLLIYPTYLAVYLYLSKAKPELVVLSNDHVGINRAFLIACKQLKIKTLYVQHASITSAFPPLKFDYAFLDGQASADFYRNEGTKIFLTGSSRFDGYLAKVKKESLLKNIGICVNNMDDFNCTLNLIEKIQTEIPQLKIYIRPHPSYTHFNELKEIAIQKGLSFSSPIEEKIYSFLINVDCLIAGDSSVHLDAAYLNIPSIFYKMGHEAFDYYRYVQNKLVLKCDTLSEIINLLNYFLIKLPHVRNTAKYYLSSINEVYDGDVAKYQAEILNKLL